MEELSTHQIITDRLKSTFGDNILFVEEPYKLLTITVAREKAIEILKFLHTDKELAFNFLTDLTGVHFPEPNEQLGVVYHLHNLYKNIRIRIKTFFPKEDPTIDTATTVFECANWMERETYDFFGILFKGHPNLKRILNVDDMDYFPMRKEYALEDATRDDKKDKMFGR